MALCLLAASLAQRSLAARFPWGAPLDHAAVYALVAILVLAGCVWLLMVRLVRLTGTTPAFATALVFVVGLAMRLLLFGTEPALEDDAYRYLWDGASVVEGFNPYAFTPEQALVNREVGPHALAIGNIRDVERVNHSWLRTPYPALAQAGFALAALIEPFSMDAWRAVIMAAELVTLVLLVLMMKALGRPWLWVTLYWWNPLIVREFAGAAHMDALLLPFLAGGALLMVRQRWQGACAALVLGAGIKLWPAVLLPMALLRLRSRPWIMIATAAGMVAGLGILAWPMLETVLTPSSGLTAFAEHWRMNGAFFGLMTELAGWAGFSQSWIRWAVACVVLVLALLLSWRAPERADAWPCRMLAVTAALFLLGPTGFPWYASWIVILLVACPVMPLLWLIPLLPLYELRFVFEDLGRAELFHDWIVWLQFGPVWLGLFVMVLRRARPVPS